MENLRHRPLFTTVLDGPDDLTPTADGAYLYCAGEEERSRQVERMRIRAPSCVFMGIKALDDYTVESDLTPGHHVNIHIQSQDFTATLGRGATPVHRVEGENVSAGSAFVHTTNLVHGAIKPSSLLSAREPDLCAATAVLFPRVGRPRKEKIVVAMGFPMVLSDCLFWVRTTPKGREQELKELILANWSAFAKLYGGSCAHYTTLKKVAQFLESHGVTTMIGHSARSLARTSTPDQQRSGVLEAAILPVAQRGVG